MSVEPGLWDPGGILSNTRSIHEQPVYSSKTEQTNRLWEPGGDLSQTCSAAEQPFCIDVSNLETRYVLPCTSITVDTMAQALVPIVSPLALQASYVVRIRLTADAG